MAIKNKFSKIKKNPSGELVEIYGRVLRIEAQKVGPHKGCDAECKMCQHKYVHDFKTKTARMIGLSPGDVIEIPANSWALLIIE